MTTTEVGDPLIGKIRALLREAGFVAAADPISIGGVSFDSIHAFVAKRGGLELIVVFTGDPSKLEGARWIARRITRALDSVASGMHLTFLLAVASEERVADLTDELLQYGRVVVVRPTDNLRRQLASFFTLNISASHSGGREGLSRLQEMFSTERNRTELANFIRLARDSPEKVSVRFGEWLAESARGER